MSAADLKLMNDEGYSVYVEGVARKGKEKLSFQWGFATATHYSECYERTHGAGVVVLTDMFGGTATNLALPFLEPDAVEIVTGVNLPMLVKLGTLREFDLSLSDLAERLTQAGQKSIRTASEFLRQRGGDR